MGTFYVENFGCRATQADGSAIECQFEERGLERASAPTSAEIVVLNTCTVTAAADQDARAAIRRIHRANPECQIVVTGCYAQRAPQEIAALPGVSQVVGNSHKHRLAEIGLRTSHLRPQTADLGPQTLDLGIPKTQGFVPLEQLTASDQRRTTKDFDEVRSPRSEVGVYVSDIFAHTELLAAPVFDAANERTRPNLKIQDGCDNRCSFCVIPYVRGQSRSLPLEEIIKQVRTLVDAGYREVVISGINLGRWGRDLGVSHQPSAVSLTTDSREPRAESRKPRARSPEPKALATVIRAILDQTSLQKLRISSVEPMDWSDELVALVASSPRIARHAHVPMQSGSDRVLRLMHRKYRPWHYREKIEKIHAAMPTAAIGADVMVGFPGETDNDFEQTRRLIEDLPFTYLHVFTYSRRPGTPAADMKHQVPVQVARERNRVLRDLAAEKKLKFMRSFVGKTVEAITLGTCDGGAMARESDAVYTDALTDNYLKLRVRGRHEANQWLRARVEAAEDGELVGVPA